MTKSEAKRIVSREVRKYIGLPGLRGIRFSMDRLFGNGACGFDLDKVKPKADISIGVAGFGNAGYDFVSRTDFVKLLVCGQHEATHADYYLSSFVNEQHVSDIHCLLASRHNGSYYRLGRNYESNVSEIDAEAGGIFLAYGFLSGSNPQESGSFLLDYVNARISEFRHFAGYHDFTEWVLAAKDIREKALRTPLPYPDWMLGHRDEFLDVTARGGPKWSYFLDVFQNAPDQVTQARMMSSVWAWLRPNQAEHFAVYREGLLVPEEVFGRPFPEDLESVLGQAVRKTQNGCRAGVVRARGGLNEDPRRGGTDGR